MKVPKSECSKVKGSEGQGQEVRRAEDQKVRRSEGSKVKGQKVRGQEAKRSRGQEVRGSGGEHSPEQPCSSLPSSQSGRPSQRRRESMQSPLEQRNSLGLQAVDGGQQVVWCVCEAGREASETCSGAEWLTLGVWFYSIYIKMFRFVKPVGTGH